MQDSAFLNFSKQVAIELYLNSHPNSIYTTKLRINDSFLHHYQAETSPFSICIEMVLINDVVSQLAHSNATLSLTHLLKAPQTSQPNLVQLKLS